MTLQSIANEIDKLQPNMTQFWEDVASNTITIDSFDKPNLSALKLFQLELLLIYRTTRRSRYIGHAEALLVDRIWRKARLEIDTINNLQLHLEYMPLPNLPIKHIPPPSPETILGHTTNPKQYLNRYLKRKIAKPMSTAYSITITDDEMALAMFTNWIQGKTLNSVQALDFAEKVRRFPLDIKNKYINLILENCPNPSIDLQKYIAKYFYASYYKTAARGYIRNCSHSVITLLTIADTADSAYKPFVSNLTTKPIASLNEYKSLVAILLMMYQTNTGSDNYKSALLNYLNLPEHDVYRNETNTILSTAISQIPKLLKDLHG